MAEVSGYNPYRKSDGKFASQDELGDVEQKLQLDYSEAQSSGDRERALAIEEYAMANLPQGELGKRLLEDRYGLVAPQSKDAPADYSKLSGSELQSLAKSTADGDLQLEISRRGGKMAKKNLARNLEASTEALALAYSSTDDSAIRQEIASNPQSDLSTVDPEHRAGAILSAAQRADKESSVSLRKLFRARAEAAASADWMDDSTLEATQRLSATQPKAASLSPLRIIRSALENRNNALSEDAALSYAERSPLLASVALESGRISPARIGELSSEAARFDRTSDRTVLSEAARLSAAGHWDEPEKDPWGNVDSQGRASRTIASALVANSATPAESVELFAGDPRVDQVALYRDSRIGESARQKIESSSPAVRSELKIRSVLGSRSQAELVKELTLSGGQSDNSRGYHRADFTLDRAKIAAYGLSKGDVERLMGGTDSAFYSYDPETGRYSGSLDSGD